MAKIILHIGTHKTATTTIQDTFHANAKTLAKLGLVYPILASHTGHHGLVSNWPSRPKAYELPGGPLNTLSAVARRYANTDKTVFLSSEEFSREGALDDLGRVRAALAPFETIEVVCVLRSQWQFLQSVYGEIAKSRVPLRPPALVSTAIDSGAVEGLFVDYNSILDRLLATFNSNEIRILDFDSLKSEKNGIVGAFLRLARISVPHGALRRVNNGASNVSPQSLACWAANIASEPYIAPDWLVRAATTALTLESTSEAPACLFTRHEYDSLRAHFSPLNESLTKRLGPGTPEIKLTFPPASAIGLYREDVKSNFWAQLSRQLVKGIRAQAA